MQEFGGHYNFGELVPAEFIFTTKALGIKYVSLFSKVDLCHSIVASEYSIKPISHHG